MIRYAFEPTTGQGRNALSVHASWGNEDILAALTMARGPYLCVFDGDDLQAAIHAERALIRFAFKNIAPRVLADGPKDARLMAKLGERYWIHANISQKQLEAARRLLVGKYEGKHKNVYLIAGERLCSPQAQQVGQSACIASWWEGAGAFQRADLIAALKSNARRLLE